MTPHMYVPVLKAGHSVSYSRVCNVEREWVYGVEFFLFFLNFPVWLVCYAHVFHVKLLNGLNEFEDSKVC